VTQNQSSKWKDFLLKSSLPLEHIVSEELERQSFYVVGEYAYQKANENSIQTEFSVDIHASLLLEQKQASWAEINLLVECKYCYPGVQWIFSPHPAASTIVGSDCIKHWDGLCTHRLKSTEPLRDFDDQFTYCIRGVEIHSSGSDPNNISRGLNQLRYALPTLVVQQARAQATTLHEEDLTLAFTCPVLLTTAQLYVLRPALDLRYFQKASALDEVARPVKSLVFHRQPGPQYAAYCRETYSKLEEEDFEIRARAAKFEEAFNTPQDDTPLYRRHSLFEHFEFLSTNILIVQLDTFPSLVKSIKRAVSKLRKSLERIAELRFDPETRAVSITKHTP